MQLFHRNYSVWQLFYVEMNVCLFGIVEDCSYRIPCKFQGRKVLQEIAHADLHKKTFTEPLILSLKSIYEQCHLELLYKKFHGHAKKHENCKLFCLETFMV